MNKKLTSEWHKLHQSYHLIKSLDGNRCLNCGIATVKFFCSCTSMLLVNRGFGREQGILSADFRRKMQEKSQEYKQCFIKCISQNVLNE